MPKEQDFVGCVVAELFLAKSDVIVLPVRVEPVKEVLNCLVHPIRSVLLVV